MIYWILIVVIIEGKVLSPWDRCYPHAAAQVRFRVHLNVMLPVAGRRSGSRRTTT